MTYVYPPCKFEKWLLENGPTERIRSFVDSLDYDSKGYIWEMVNSIPEEFRDPLTFPSNFEQAIDSALEGRGNFIQGVWYDSYDFASNWLKVWFDLEKDGVVVHLDDDED